MDNCHGSCLLKDEANAEIVAEAIEHFDHNRYLLFGYVIMPNHVHLLVSPAPDHSLSSILQSWKRFSAREINKRNQTNGTIWQTESFDHIARSAAQLNHFQDYLRENPQKANLHVGQFLLNVPKEK